MPDHVYMLICVPPKYALSAVMGYIKAKSAVHVARHFMRRERNHAGQRPLAREFFMDTVGRYNKVISRHIREREVEDERLDQFGLPMNKPTDEP